MKYKMRTKEVTDVRFDLSKSFQSPFLIFVLGTLLLNLFTFSFFIFPVNACPQAHPSEKTFSSWKKHCHHPLCARLYDLQKKSLIGASSSASETVSECNPLSEELYKIQNASSVGSVLLLGEVHDNVEHHRFRANFVRPPVVVMEQFNTEQQSTLDTILKSISNVPQDERPTTFNKALTWEKSPWSTYDYEQLFKKLLDSQIAIRAGDPPLALVRKISKYGSAALTTQEIENLVLNENFEKGDFNDLKAEIKDSHCGMLPDTILGNFAFAQRYRDAILADSTVQAVKKYGGGIVLAGNAHVRKDRGIPWYLERRLDTIKFLSIMLLEVEEGKEKPEDYDVRTSKQNPIADYIVFTPKAKREDPCLKFGKVRDLGK